MAARRRRGKTPRKLLVVKSLADPLMPDVSVTLVWVAPDGEMLRKTMPWKRGKTVDAIEEWLDDYRERVQNGYEPAGFLAAPMPHCARVSFHGKVVAEWNRPLTIDEMMRLDQKQRAS